MLRGLSVSHIHTRVVREWCYNWVDWLPIYQLTVTIIIIINNNTVCLLNYIIIMFVC